MQIELLTLFFFFNRTDCVTLASRICFKYYFKINIEQFFDVFVLKFFGGSLAVNHFSFVLLFISLSFQFQFSRNAEGSLSKGTLAVSKEISL